MKMRNKFIVTFSLVFFFPIFIIFLIFIYRSQNMLKDAVGFHFETIAREKAKAIGLILQARVAETEILASIHEVKDAVRESNEGYSGETDDQIQDRINRIDKEWIKTKGGTETASRILN